MKQMFSAAVLIAIFCFNVFAQAVTVSCPEVKVLGPSRMWREGETAVFYALVGNRLTNEYKYFWSVTEGTIINGRETSKIDVNTIGLSGVNITAVVKVSGLPKACNDQASETGSVAPRPSGPHPDDQFSMSNKDVRHRLDNFFVELQNDPQSEGLIVLNFTNNTAAAKKRRYLKLISDHLRFRKMDPMRITFAILENADYEQTLAWRVRQGWMPLEKDKKYTLILAEYLKDRMPYLFKK